jgi:hypothetical protein
LLLLELGEAKRFTLSRLASLAHTGILFSGPLRVGSLP